MQPIYYKFTYEFQQINMQTKNDKIVIKLLE